MLASRRGGAVAPRMSVAEVCPASATSLHISTDKVGSTLWGYGKADIRQEWGTARSRHPIPVVTTEGAMIEIFSERRREETCCGCVVFPNKTKGFEARG